MPSYTSVTASLSDRWREFRHLRRYHSDDVGKKMQVFVQRMRDTEAWIEQETGVTFRNRRVLDVGCGQHMRQARYFAQHNDVDAIDYDVLPTGLDVGQYLTMLRRNGPVRLAKTVARKTLGIDRRYGRELRQALDLQRLPPVRFTQMDACGMSFPDETFDLVFSRSVWQHIADLEQADSEVARVLRPGGVAFISIHLFTSDSGAHDPRVWSGDRGDVPYWAHLRPQCESLVHTNTWQNRLRLDDWKQAFGQHMPGARFRLRQHGREHLSLELQKLRDIGELSDYADDELLTVDLWVLWQKPLTDEAR